MRWSYNVGIKNSLIKIWRDIDLNLASHIRIANQTLKSIDDKIDCKVYKPVYLLGSIAPVVSALNVAFTKHTNYQQMET